MKVLIVDDERDIRESLEDFFLEEGFEVQVAADGAEALRLLKSAADPPPCVVILDLVLPKLSGNEVYREMQTDPRLAKMPVVISTSDPSKAPSGLLTLKKPVDLDLLLSSVRGLCR